MAGTASGRIIARRRSHSGGRMMNEIVDAHHHVWDPARRDYPWMTGPAAVLRTPYTVDDLRAETKAVGVHRTVLVQTVSELAETEEFLAVAAESGGVIP